MNNFDDPKVVTGTRTRIKWEYILILLLIIPSVLYAKDIVIQNTKPESKPIESQNLESVDKPKAEDKIEVSESQNGTVIKDWKLPISNEVGIPVDISELKKTFLYQKTKNKLTEIPGSTGFSGGSLDLGESGPKSSPDRKYTVYLNTSRELFLMSNQSLESVRISNQPVMYITGWMMDSKRLIYYVQPDTIVSRTEGMAPDLNIEKFDNSKHQSGFFMFDIEKGETVFLYPVTSVKAIIGGNKLVVTLDETNGSYVVFNIDTFEADYDTLENTKKDVNGLNQIVSSQKGDKWAYLYAFNPTKDGNLIYADYPVLPNNDGSNYKFIEQGAWAEYQWPKFSPDDKKISFIKGAAEQKGEVYIYDVDTEKAEMVSKGFSADWVDNETLLIRESVTYGSPAKFSVYDLVKKELKDLVY